MVVSETTGERPSAIYGTEGVFLMTNYDKPFLTYKQMIEKMKSRNVIIEDEDFAVKALKNCSYYTLMNGYKETFCSSPAVDNFYVGTQLEELFTMHTIDRNLGSILLKNILHIEQSLKSSVSYIVSQNYGVYASSVSTSSNANDYLHRGNYSKGRADRNNTIAKLRSILDIKSNGYKSPSLKHYAKNHNHIPAWILTTSMTLGETSKWYDILKKDDKTWVCNSIISNDILDIQSKKEYLRCALKILRQFRNAIAHGGRVYLEFGNIEIPKDGIVALSNGVVTADEYDKNRQARTGLHAVIGIIFSLLNDRYLQRYLFRDFLYLLDDYQEVTIHAKSVPEILSLPKNIANRLFLAINSGG